MSLSYEGFLSDGQSGGRYAVTVLLGSTSLTIMDNKAKPIADWPYGPMRLVEEVYPGQPVRLKPGRKDNARLTIPDSSILDELSKKSRRIARKNLRKSNSLRRGLIWGGSLIAVVCAFVFGVPIAAEPIASVIPLKWEEALGRSVSKQAIGLFSSSSRRCTNPAGQAALERLVTRLSATTKSRYTFRITVIDHKLVNAFAAPGGYVVVFRGLIDKTPTADGLAGVMAHEMGHVIERHGMEGVVKAVGISIVMGALIGDTSSVGGAATGLATDLLNKSYGRSAEREADKVGVRMLNKSNIKGTGFAAFFQKIAKKEGKRGGFGDYFVTHPSSSERAAKVLKTAKGTGPAMSKADWQAIKTICR